MTGPGAKAMSNIDQSGAFFYAYQWNMRIIRARRHTTSISPAE
jgi:hypothetical protein